MKKIAIFIVAYIMMSVCGTPVQLYWDHKVKSLCHRDGGVIVYEKIHITRSDKNKLKMSSEKHVTEKDDYYFVLTPEEIINKSPYVRRSVYSMYRNTDKKLIATQIYYSRVGGDIPTGIAHPSSFSCDEAGVSTDIDKAVFVIKE